jgi:methyl acetate hydrolase
MKNRTGAPSQARSVTGHSGIVGAALVGAARLQNSPGGAAIDAVLRGAVERHDVPGVVALVTDRRRVLYQGAFGVADISTGRALTTDALFRIASMTKPVTSMAAMQLIEQGLFSLDDPVEKYLPEFANLKVFEWFDATTGDYRLRPASRPPAVRHILTHTSGLGYPFTSAILRDFKPQPGESYPFGGPLLFDPGERWHYGTSTDVAGKLVEKVSGQKLEDYFREHIFAPLQMPDTFYNVPQEKASPLLTSGPASAWTAASYCRRCSPGSPSRSPPAVADLPRRQTTMVVSCACCSMAASSRGLAGSRPKRLH